MTTARMLAWGLAAGLATLPALAQAPQPTRIALVIGTGAYAAAGREAVPACPASAREVAATLRGLGYRVTERIDPGRGAADAGIAAFARELRDAPGAAAIAYVCGHVAGMGDRPFLLPASATLERETDLMTQGVLVRLLPDAMQRGQASAALVVLDGFVPSRPAAAPLAATFATLARAAEENGVGMAVALSNPQAAPTALAAALREELAEPTVRVASLVAGLRTRLPPGSLVGFGLPATAGLLAGTPPAPPPPPAAAPPAAPPAPAAAPAAPPPPVAAAPASAAAAPAGPPMPEEAQMTAEDRRRVQQALSRMGYYAGQADGVFGPNTRAAIRRFQFEIGAEMTGTLTGAQATRLLRP